MVVVKLYHHGGTSGVIVVVRFGAMVVMVHAPVPIPGHQQSIGRLPWLVHVFVLGWGEGVGAAHAGPQV